ncbi:hypothetical protein HPP92_021331 [Vanilla planifolia]|uniref:Uncharacterized protein n=1 Tax=Vanilla planifolia TaxID=51239 RepID=A0A835UFF1_VANPL|nr:hypothetical protein HPP92_021331 [Vanilla planifolia]
MAKLKRLILTEPWITSLKVRTSGTIPAVKRAEYGMGVENVSNLDVSLDEEVKEGDAPVASQARENRKGRERFRWRGGASYERLEDGTGRPSKASTDERVGEEKEGKWGMRKAEMQAEEVEEAEGKAGLIFSSQNKKLNVAWAHVVGDEGSGKGGMPALVPQ